MERRGFSFSQFIRRLVFKSPTAHPDRPAILNVTSDPLVGCKVEIRSSVDATITYRGIVKSIHHDPENLGELVELGSATNAGYQRFVYVTDRRKQVRELGPETASPL